MSHLEFLKKYAAQNFIIFFKFSFLPLAANSNLFRVFNRYGQVMYESNNIQNGWDGTFKGQKQLIGNYIWSIKGKGRDGNMIEMKGSVVLVR